MAVPTKMTDLDVEETNNSPAGSDTVTSSTGPDDYLRAISAILRRLQAKGANVASNATVDLGAIDDGSYVHITGTTTITSFGTTDAGISRILVFDDALTITYDATSMILPGSADITTAAGDVMMFVSEGSGNWRCTGYLPAAGWLGKNETAADSDKLGGTAASGYVLASDYEDADVLAKIKNVDGAGSGLDADLVQGGTPVKLSSSGNEIVKIAGNVIKNQPTAWAAIESDGTIVDSHNVSSVSFNGSYIYTITFATAMDNTNYCVVATSKGDGWVSDIGSSTMTTSAVSVLTRNKSGSGVAADFFIVIFGGRS